MSIAKQESAKEPPEYKADDGFETKMREEENFSGSFFTEVRKYKNMNLGYISSLTKIAAYHLEAIEREDHKSLPAKVYVRGFVKSYAKALGLDVDKTVTAYMQRYDKA